MTIDPKLCDHNFTYQGLVYSHADMPLPGTGARQRYYEDRYFCTKCLTITDTNRRAIGHSYDAVMNNAAPKDSERRHW